jgi:hypothetical protein
MLAFRRGISHVHQVGVGNADIDSQDISAVYGIVFPPSILDVVTNVDELDGAQEPHLDRDETFLTVFSRIIYMSLLCSAVAVVVSTHAIISSL